MKKWLLMLFVLSACFYHARATHVAGAEITYQWLHDSTFRIYYHFYRDCKGIPEPTSVDLCYSNNCGSTTGYITLYKMTTIPPGVDNGTELTNPCPGRPTTCGSDTSTIPGYREWWYSGTLTLNRRCDHWTFSHTESLRNGSIINLDGGYGMYVSATLDNLNAPTNSSAFFTVKPVPYICNNSPFTFNNGAYDNDNDSLNFYIAQPLSSTGACDTAIPIPGACCTLPLHPLPCSGIFRFNDTTGQMSFTPNAVGPSVLAFVTNELRYISGKWDTIATTRRDIMLIVRPCNVSIPVSSVTEAIVGGSMSSGILNACATVPLAFCFYSKASVPGNMITVKDNHSYFNNNPVVSYTHTYTDSVRGCFSWTAGVLDTGLKIFAITVTDSTCTGIGIPVSATYSIPIHIWPITKILREDTGAVCSGDSVLLTAIGGGNFVWDVMPGGSTIGSLSCTTCKTTIARPNVTTSYIVHSNDPTNCSKNRDTITINVSPAGPVPSVSLSTTAWHGISSIDTFTATAVNCGSSPVFKWYKNGSLISGVNISRYITTGLAWGDIIKVFVHSSIKCAVPDSATASLIVLELGQLSAKNNINLYPNPNDGSFTIKATIIDIQDKQADIEIINMAGQLIYKDEAAIANGILNKHLSLYSKLANGVYLLKIKYGEQAIITQFSIQK